MVSVVLDAHGFDQVLERLDFLRRVRDSDTEILGAVRRGRDDAHRDERRARGASSPAARAHRRGASAARRAGADAAALQARRDALAAGRSIRIAALQQHPREPALAEHELTRLLAAQARAAVSQGPGGPWAIPWPIVECESGGQNLPPNYASASGYYQMLDSTWHGPRRQHAARLPGLEGRAGPPRRDSCGRAGRARTTGSAPRIVGT